MNTDGLSPEEIQRLRSAQHPDWEFRTYGGRVYGAPAGEEWIYHGNHSPLLYAGPCMVARPTHYHIT